VLKCALQVLNIKYYTLRVFSLGRNIQSSLVPRPQTSNTFLRICANSRSADLFIVLVRSLIHSCSEWSASFFDTEPNAPTTTGTTFVLDFLILLISFARSWYFSYFSVSFCSISSNSYVRNDCFLWLLFLNYNVWPPVVDFIKVPYQFYFLILFNALGGMLIPFVTALYSIFLAQLPVYDPPNNIMRLFIFCLRKLGAATQNMLHRKYHTFCIWMVHFGFRFWLLRRLLLVPDHAWQK